MPRFPGKNIGGQDGQVRKLYLKKKWAWLQVSSWNSHLLISKGYLGPPLHKIVYHKSQTGKLNLGRTEDQSSILLPTSVRVSSSHPKWYNWIWLGPRRFGKHVRASRKFQVKKLMLFFITFVPSKNLTHSVNYHPLFKKSRYFVAPMNHSDPHYLGHGMTFWGEAYNWQNAGYALSKVFLSIIIRWFFLKITRIW